MYVWTQKGVDDYAIRHPYVNLKRNPRKVGEEATYDDKPLMSGEVQRAYSARGLIELKREKKRASKTTVKRIPMPKKLVGLDDIPKKRDLVIWKELLEYSQKGCSITETSIKYGMPISEIESFVRKNHKKFEEEIGRIDFSRKSRRIFALIA